MLSKIYASSEDGVHSLMRIVSTLKRKEFDVVGVNMASVDNQTEMCITLREHAKLNAEYAKYQLEKMIDLNNISIEKGEN